MMAPNTDRAEFEKWLSDTYNSDSEWIEERKCYRDFPVHMAWQAWRAAKRSDGPKEPVWTNFADALPPLDSESDLTSRPVWIACQGAVVRGYIHSNGWAYNDEEAGGLFARYVAGPVQFSGWEKFPMATHWMQCLEWRPSPPATNDGVPNG